jgi:hypothetical protein
MLRVTKVAYSTSDDAQSRLRAAKKRSDLDDFDRRLRK